MGLPEKITDDLTATVKRLAPAIPQVAALFRIEIKEGAAMPRPLRNNPAKERREKKKVTKLSLMKIAMTKYKVMTKL